MADQRFESDLHQEGVLYPAEDVQQILSLAIAQQTEAGDLSRTQLLEIAEELGIAPETVAAAEREWEVKKVEIADQRIFDSQLKQRLHNDLVQYALWGIGALGLHVTLGFPWTWLLYIIFGPWALQIAWDAWRIYRPHSYSYRKAFERWRRQQQMKRAVSGMVRRLFGPV